MCFRPSRLLPRALLSGALIASFCAASVHVRADAIRNKADQFVRKALESSPNRGATSVILKIDGALTSDRTAQLTSLGADIYRRLPLIQSAAARVPNRALSRVAALPFVLHISGDVQVRKTDEFTVGSSGAGTAYSKYGLTGDGVGIAVVDSGIRQHEDLTKPG